MLPAHAGAEKNTNDVADLVRQSQKILPPSLTLLILHGGRHMLASSAQNACSSPEPLPAQRCGHFDPFTYAKDSMRKKKMPKYNVLRGAPFVAIILLGAPCRSARQLFGIFIRIQRSIVASYMLTLIGGNRFKNMKSCSKKLESHTPQL